MYPCQQCWLHTVTQDYTHLRGCSSSKLNVDLSSPGRPPLVFRKCIRFEADYIRRPDDQSHIAPLYSCIIHAPSSLSQAHLLIHLRVVLGLFILALPNFRSTIQFKHRFFRMMFPQ
ncbi:hypothetical protein K439DRAFT_499473 [Ramaria rubella]|nr:hypothetical protein K439DRAFT_499473 [Ramaria rubella]